MINLRNLWGLSYVPRWVVVRTLRRQSVAEHSFNVATIALWLVRTYNVTVDMGRMLEYALMHDEDEAIHGDSPSPIKNQRITDDVGEPVVSIIVKMADILEMLAFVEQEHLLGNTTLGIAKQHLESRMCTATEIAAKVLGTYSPGHVMPYNEHVIIGAMFDAMQLYINPIDKLTKHD